MMSSEVLSQSEIDALLAAISSGDMDTNKLKEEESNRKVRAYDFKRALRFSKDQIRTLTRIHENYARLLTSFLSGQLRTYVEVKVASVDQLPYHEFIMSIPKTTVLSIFEADPLEGNLVLEMHPSVSSIILDRLQGGPGFSTKDNRTLSEIESGILERVFIRSLDILANAWENVIEFSPSLKFMEMNPQFVQIISPNETVIVISFSVKIGETTGIMNLCLPHIVLEPVMPKLSGHYWLSTQKKTRNEDEIRALHERVKNVQLPLIVDLGVSHMTVHEFLNLSKSDVIILDTTKKDLLNVRVGSKVKYTGEVGTVGNKMALQIKHVVEEGAGDYE